MAETTEIMAADRLEDHGFYVQQIAAAAFPYPNDEHPDWTVHTNAPTVTAEVPVPTGGPVETRPPGAAPGPARGVPVKLPVARPDIVVLAGPSQTAVICGEVVGVRDRMEDEIERWRPVTRVSKLHVFVPVGWAGYAKKLVKREKLNVSKLYTYRWTPLGMEINPA